MSRFYVGGLSFTGGASTFQVQYGDDPTWNTFTTAGVLSVNSGGQNFSGNIGGKGRYLRLAPTAFGSNGQAIVDSLIVYSDNIGVDASGNTNHWVANNISLTAGVTYDSMLDVPTMWADGGNGRGNYCVLNPVFKNANATYGVMATPIDGNLNATSIGAGTNVYGSIDLFGNKGKWYAECRASSIVSQVSIGFLSDDGNLNRGAWINSSSGVLVDNVSKSTSGFASGNTVGIAYDSINNTVQFYVNNSAVGSAYTTSTGSFSSYLFWSYTNSGVSLEWNFGQRPFSYTPPTGFKALNTQNLPDATIKKGNAYFNATTYTGTGATLSVTNSGSMQPDLVWIKDRSAARSHRLFDTVRGATKGLFSDATDAETTLATDLTAFNSNGFTLGVGLGSNASTETYVGWQWKESASAGFDIVTYTGTGSNMTISHSLGVAPKMIIIKARSASATDWPVYHSSIGNTGALLLNTTNQTSTSSLWWNNTSPSSSVFTLGTIAASNTNTQTQVAYLFAEVAGYSKFGSYTGNGSTDGPFVYTGFRPRWVLWKRSDSTSDWNIIDTTRNTYNYADKELFPNLSTAETVIGGGLSRLDMLSNGFKVRGADSYQNANGGTYIFMALAENPFKNSLAR
jgi:hypothetical protein